MKEKILAAKKLLADSHTFLNPVLWRIKTVENNEIPTCAMDRYGVLYYNSRFVEEIPVKVLKTVLYHEILHFLKDHAERLKSFPCRLQANIAADLEINDDILLEGLDFGELSPVFHFQFGFPAGLTAEEYYALLEKKDIEQKEEILAGDCGSVADGRRRPYEDEEANNDGRISEVEKELIKKEVAERLKQCGNIPAHWRRFADEIDKKGKISWRRKLAEYISSFSSTVKGYNEQSYRKVRYRLMIPLKTDIIFPGFIERRIRISVIIDTSGSMYDAQLSQVLKEVNSLLMNLNVEVKVICFDCEKHFEKKIRRVNEIELWGGGGTDMRKAILEEQEKGPDLIIVMTDGFSPFPSQEEIKTNVLIVSFGNKDLPSYLRTVFVEEEKC